MQIAGTAAQDHRYAVFELPGLSQNYQWAGGVDINSAGHAVGFTALASFHIRAVVWPSRGGVIDLGTLGGESAAATGINDSDEICGWAVFDPGGSFFDRHAFLWRDGDMTDLGTLGGETSWANALNGSAQVVGESEYAGGTGAKAFVWENGEMRVLPAPHPDWDGRAAFDINDLGEIVGYGYGVDAVLHALLWRNGNVTDLGSLSNLESKAYGINEGGVIVGYSRMPDNYVHAVRWTNGQIEDVHTANVGPNSIARGINNVGQIVGDAYVSTRAFILNPGEQMMLLDDLVPPQLRLAWTMQRTTHINDAGQIPVTAEYDGDTWALLLTPVNPTMTLQSPVPGSAGTTNRLRATGATPGARVYFCYSRHGGGTRIPGCDLQQNALQLDQPTIIGSAIADANGVASITRAVPLIARGQTILFQAVVQNECAISQLVVHEFE
ncbi:MAG: hypothetical protein IT430_02130 [Phycisphaerales bacterium]|nr:hypothetical protein [Phycisphaerales bacterium]